MLEFPHPFDDGIPEDAPVMITTFPVDMSDYNRCRQQGAVKQYVALSSYKSRQTACCGSDEGEY